MSPPRARKRFGQHFLTDPSILGRIAGALELSPGETVVEIGPGRGALTDHLLETGANVIAIEIDRDLAGALKERHAAQPRFRLVEGDVLDQPLGELGGAGYALAGNIPYNITTPIIFHALEAPHFSRAVFLVQREVAARLAAAAGSEAYGALTVNVAAHAHVEPLFGVPAGAFRPAPRVESSVVRLRRRDVPLFPPESAERLQRFVIDAFTMRRKQMRRVVREIAGVSAEKAEAMLREAGIDPEARPEVLSPGQFAVLGEWVPGSRRPGKEEE